ncbi:hypothetical protein [Streptomyces sp. NRRL S-146]|uniref:hypothetical protein n=1 Tax=Streptomyces sp. NRRL S-146 TaxID=1463884 RepID=UPI00131BD687|nr:hypothetical protein [Streptomyces sp. NRRL S-146]
MLNRTASSVGLSRALETKSVRRPWNPALHPRDSKGRFIETGGVARLWSGKLARVVRALPRDRVLVQDRAADGTFTGRRHSTSARWITMVARPDGSAPTSNQKKVEAEDARREQDQRRGLGLSRDDHGDPDTPDQPHYVDDAGNTIGDDEGDAPEDDDQDEPESGHHDVDTEALPNRKARSGARFEDTAAVRRHFLDLAQQPGANAPALRRLAGDEDLQITPSGGLVTTRDDTNGRWYLTSTGTGGYLDVGDFATREEAEAAAEYISEHVRNGHIMPGEFNEPIDFSDPKIGDWLLTWRSTKGEDAEQAIRRAVRDFRASRAGSDAPQTPAPKRQRPQARGRFTTLQQARDNWTQRAETLRASGSEQDRSTARDLDNLAKEQRLKLVGDGQFVTRRVEGDWYLYATGNGQQMPWWFDRQSDAKGFAEHIVGTLKDKDGNPLDFSDPKFADYRRTWRSAEGHDYIQEWTAARALWDQEHPPKHSIATARLAETLRRRPFGDDEDQSPRTGTPTKPTPEPAPALDAAPQPKETPETGTDGRPAGVPEDAEPVDGVPGYWATSWNPGPVTVYGPDGTRIASVVGGYSDRHATVDGVYVPIGSNANIADQIIARHHLATTNPDQADHVHLAWTTHKGKRVLAVRGTIKNDARDDRAVGAAGKLAWSPVQKARITGTQWKPETRDRKAADILAAFVRQSRNVRVTDEDANANTHAPEKAQQLDEDTKKLRAMSDADLRGQRDNLKIHAQVATTHSRKQRARAALQKVEAELDRRRIAQNDENNRDEPETKPSAQDRAAAMSDTDLAEAISRSERDRGTYGSRRGDRLTDDERALYADRRRRTTDQVAQTRNPEDLSDEELAAHIKDLEARERTHKLSGTIHEEDDLAPERDLWNDLTNRLADAETEQQTRKLRDLEQRPPVQDLDDDALERESLGLPIRLRRLGAEQNEILSARRHAVYEERQNRKADVYRNGPDPAGLSDADLDKAFRDLHKNRNLTSGREREALEERLKALFDEQNRRGAEGREQKVNRADTRDNPLRSTYGASVRVDGNDYGKVSYHEHDSPYAGGHKAGWNAQRQSHGGYLGAYPSMTEALAALVDSYDTDPATEPVRLYGSVRRVWVPKMFFELYQSSRRADSFPSASKERQTLYGLFKGHGYGWSDSTNPITGKIGKGANLDVPEGLLAEFHRVTEELSREMMLRASDRELDSSDRSKARSRLASINAALHGIDAQRTAVRKDGGDDDRKVISRQEIEAQQAALRAALGTDEGADGEHLQPGGQGSLGAAPAAGAGGDDRSRDVLPEQGQGDRDGDSGGRGDAGGDRAGGDGVRGSGGSDQADQGGRDRDGDAGSAAGAGAGDRGDAGAQSGDAGSAGAEGRGVRHVAPRFRPNPADAATKGPIQRAAANVEAIRVLKRLERENRPATEKEKVTLARWTGWGSVPIMFASEPNEKEPRYQQGGARYGKFAQDHARWAEYRELRTMLSGELTPLEWQQARRGTLSMHYTPQPIAEAMWDGLKALGFDRGDVLEAGSGSGTFFGVSPEGARLTGIELDPTTAWIAKAIYPDANVLNENFAETDAHPGTFDASIGNVPFASVPFGDRRYPAESLHNGFITKELVLTRPGGITLLITSRHTLDSKGDKARKQIAKYGDLIGAVRLPSGVFNDAGTSVVTDVLVLRSRADGDEPGDTSWLNAPERKIGNVREHVNAYFTAHPEHVLGDLTTESSPYGPRLTVKGNPAKAADQLRDALKDIADKAKADGKGYEPHPDGDNRPPVFLQTAREKHANDWTGRLYEGDDGKLYQHVNGGNPVAVEPSDGRGDQLRALMQLRDVAAELRALDRKNDEDGRAEKLRAQLRDLHTAYVEQYGPLSKPGQFRSMKTGTRPDGSEERTPTAWGYFRSDPDAGSVLALERWDADKQEPILSRVFTERAAARRQPLDRTDDPKTALSAVVAATGQVDLGEIARLLNMDPQDAVRALGNEVFTDPSTGRLELAGAYLSGPVRDKLAAARRAAEKDPAFAVNVSALEAVQPADRTIGEFTPEMGAHWTPPELLQGFLREYLGDKTLRVAHDDRYGWMLYTGKVPQANNVLYGVEPNAAKGTKGKSAVEIARAILGHGSLTIYHDDKRRDVDEETSRLVRQKADQMRSEFAKYATANADRLTRLTDSYNKIMNGHVVRSYDGMSPSLDGFTPDRTPHAWQLSGAARMQFERSVILTHEVGLGKTSTLVMGTQALKASGQIEKPYAVVPDHLAQQWYDEARFLYPNAEIHLITSGDLADGRRDSTLEWLRANKPDLVIFTEPAFGSIKMSPEAQEEYEFRELEALREQLDRQYEDADNPNHPFIVAKIEQRIATVQNRISKNAAPMRTPGQTYWDDLGFDYAVIDEAHRYKGVGFRSREGGGDPASIRGIDLHQKLTDLHRRRAGRATVTLATGTPLSNSITEQFTMLALAAPWVLDAYKAGAPDLWAATFGRKTLRVENAPDGSGLRIVERFAEFHNRRAMKTMWGLVADTKRADDVGIPRPKIADSGPNLVMVDPTKDQTARLKKLVARGRAIHNGDVDRSQDNMLAVSNEGTSVALDPRLVDAKAPAGNKLTAVAAKAVERYSRHKDRVYKTYYGNTEDHPTPGALQMVFLNEGVPGGNNRGNFDAYAELKRLMVAGGIPEEKIAFVQDHKKTGKPEELAELFRRARDGEIAVLIGSSSVAGTGMNAQNRMVSLTHVDLDWGAAQMEQRNGRILRYGNQNAEVEIDIFATKGSLDGWKAGFVASKAEGLVDIQRPEMADSDTRDTVTELDVDYPDYETMEAEIGGNPYMSQLMKARRLLRDLEIDQHNEAAERVRRQETLAELEKELADTRDGITRREEALPRIRDVRDTFAMNLGGLSYTERADAAAALHRQVTTRLLEHDRDGMGPWKVLGQFGGLDVAVRTERRADGRLIAHVGFPDLARSDFERGPDDLKKRGAGSGMITRLTNALEKAPALQQADRARLPELDEQIALLQSAQAAADLTPQIEHARARANLLDDIVGRIADLDKLPEIDENEVDKKLTKAQRRQIVEERHQARIPLQAAVGAAVLTLDNFDEKFPEPERTEKPEQPERPDAPEQQDHVRLSAEEVSQTLGQLRPEGDNGTGAEDTVDGPDTADEGDGGERRDLTAAPAAPGDDASENDDTDQPAPGRADDVPQPDAPIDQADSDDETAAAEDDNTAESPDNTVTLDRDEIDQQLDAIRPEGTKAPSAMTDQEIADEIVALMEREMADGELTGADRTRMAVLEAETDRRAGRPPKPEPKKPEPEQPEGGLFDIGEPEPQAPAVADPNNPLDQPDDASGTPDMFADHEGRDTSRLRPVQMRNPEDLAQGDRYTDADGRTHTVAEPPQRTGRGRVRIVIEDGEERFYSRDAELRLRHPDEEIDDDLDEQPATGLGSNNTPDQPDREAAPDQQDDEEQPQNDDAEQSEDEDDEQRHRRDRDADADGAAPDGAPEGADGDPKALGTDRDNADNNADAGESDAQENEDDRERRRHRRRRRGDRGGNGGGGPDGPGLPRLDLPHPPNIPAANSGGTDGDGGEPDRTRPRTVADLRDAWRRGDRLTADENTPERRAFLTQLAGNPTLTLSSGGGLVTWTDDTAPDGMRRWQFAQTHNGGRLGKITLTARTPDDARDLADLFEFTPDASGQAIDWHQPLTPDVIAQWRDRQGRTLPEALRATRDLFQDGDEQGDTATQPKPAATLPEDLTGLSDDDLADAWGQGLSDADQMRVAEEMDRRDSAEQRVRDAIPTTPAADAEEVRRRGEAMDAALGFGATDVTRRPQTREERLQREFQDVDEARYSAAVDATNGYFFSRASRSLPPVSERDLFSGGSLSRFGRWRDYASDELIEWFDNNGGRLTYNQYKQRRRADEKIERQQYEEEQRRAAASTPATPDTDNTALALSIDDIDLPSFTLTPEAEEEANRRFGGADQVRALAARAELRPAADDGTFDVWLDGRRIGTVRNVNRNADDREPMWDATPLLTINHDHNSRSANRDLAVANLVVRAERNPANATNPNKDIWDTVKVHLAGRNPELPELPGSLSNDPAVKERYDQLVHLVESFRSKESPSGNLAQDLEHIRDEFQWLRETLSAAQGKRQDRDALKDLERRSFWAERLRAGFGQDNEHQVPDAPGDEPDAAPAVLDTAPSDAREPTASGDNSEPRTTVGDQQSPADGTTTVPDTRPGDATPDAETIPEPSRDDSEFARTSGDDAPTLDAGPAPGPRPQPEPTQTPESTDESTAEPDPRPEPEPIGGQPAHWGSVDQLQPRDVARIDGTTRRGRRVTRAGYVLDTPERVTVTRRGRTEDMWRTTIGETPDGRTGGRGTVYTPLNASAARAEAPETAAPGTPASGAQGDVMTGGLPDSIANDSHGRGLFPGSHVTGGDRDGTVTGVTDTTVSVRWTNGDTDNGVAPTSLTVDDTADRRLAGWTSTGQRLRPGHVVSDENGALLGPVDEADGDRITITTSEGTVTRDAAGLRVVGEVRDDTPQTAPVTGLSEPTADEITKGDIIVLDLDGTPTTVEILDTSRDGDRVTLDYVDTTTAETGSIDMDSTAVVHKAEGPNGAAPDLGPDDAPATDDDLTVHEPLPAVDPVIGPTVDPDLTPADRDAIADNGSSPEDDPHAQQAAARLGADLPVTPDQAAALAAQLRANADSATTEGRAALRAADHLDRAAGRPAPEWLSRPRPSNAAQISEGDFIAMPDERRGDAVHVYRVIDVEEGPGGVRSLLLEDENRQWKRRIVHAAMPVWQLPEAAPDADTALDPEPAPRDPNPPLASVRRQIVADHSRTVAMRIIDEAVAGTEPPGDIHALREQIAQRLNPESLQDARNTARQDANAALNAAGITGRDRAAVQQALRRAREKAHERTVRAALRTINDLEPLPGEPNEDLAQRAAGLLRLIPEQIDAPSITRRASTASAPRNRTVAEGDGAADAVKHVDDAVTALLRQLEEAGVDPADLEALTRLLTRQLDATRQATAQRIVRRSAAADPDTGRQPGLLALLGRMGRRLIELVKAAARKIAELWRDSRDRISRLRSFLRRLVRRVRDWPEARRLAQLNAVLDLLDVEGESLAARVSQWVGLLPEQGRFGQASRRVSRWRPTTWAQLAAGRLPGRSSDTRWVPDRASDGGPGLTALRHMAALRAAGADVDQDVTRRLAAALGDDFGRDPHGALQHADDYVAATERRLLNLQAARGSSTVQDPDVDVEIAAARMEATTARREWEELRSRYAAAVPDAVAAALADVRDLGPQGNTGIVFGPDSTPDAERAIRDVQRHMPRDWLAFPDGRRLTAVDGDTGRYEPDARRATVADLGDAGVGTAAHALAQHLAGHVPDLDAAQSVFWFTRTHNGRPGARTLDRTALGRLLDQQQTRPDTGDSLARSLQAMFTGDWYLDDDLRSFLLGLLATR